MTIFAYISDRRKYLLYLTLEEPITYHSRSLYEHSVIKTFMVNMYS